VSTAPYQINRNIERVVWSDLNFYTKQSERRKAWCEPLIAGIFKKKTTLFKMFVFYVSYL
jgi:hypothetical protein